MSISLVISHEGKAVFACPVQQSGFTIATHAGADFVLPPKSEKWALSIMPTQSRMRATCDDDSLIRVGDDDYAFVDLIPNLDFKLGTYTFQVLENTNEAQEGRTQRPYATQILEATMLTSAMKSEAETLSYLKAEIEHMKSGRKVGIAPQGLKVGALEGNDLCLENTTVSGIHALLFVENQQIIVRDLGSTNGTRVNKRRIQSSELEDGDIIQFGDDEWRFSLTQHQAPSDAEIDRDAQTGATGLKYQLGDLRSGSESMAKVFHRIQRAAPFDASVLIHGETGTGKELVARAIHHASKRKVFVALNCASIPENLAESILFGHQKGSFTGAQNDHAGVFEEASGGTLFLDEIGELPLALQAKMLRVLEISKVQRVGASREVRVDTRIVAATHRDLNVDVIEGRFREDLLHRLCTVPIRLPALRDRDDDALHLAEFFLAHFSNNRLQLAAATCEKIKAYPFPGNIRELRNAIQRAMIFAEGNTVEPDELELLTTPGSPKTSLNSTQRETQGTGTMEDIEKAAIAKALNENPSSAAAARALGMPRTSLWRKALSYGLIEKKTKA